MHKGMPSNVRRSALADLELDGQHSIDEALRPIVTIQNGGLSVKDMPVRLVPAVEDPNGSKAPKKNAPYRAVLQPIGTR